MIAITVHECMLKNDCKINTQTCATNVQGRFKMPSLVQRAPNGHIPADQRISNLHALHLLQALQTA